MQLCLNKSIGKNIGVKVSPYFQPKALVSLLAILFVSIVNKPGYYAAIVKP